LPDISALNGTAIDNVAEFDGLTVTDVAPAFVGLLDETYGSGAAAAYSTRRLASATTVLLRVRRDTGGTGDDDVADVAYDTNNQLSLDSAISNASPNVSSTTLGEFLNATGYTDVDNLTVVADGFCDTWYDQSGNGIDAEQTIFGEQPQIFDSASPTDLIKTNGQPSIYFDKTLDNNLVTPSSSWSTAGDTTIFCAWDKDTVSGAAEVWSNVAVRWFGGTGVSQVYVAPTSIAYTAVEVQNLFTYEHRDGVSKSVYIDGSQEATSATPGAVPTSSSIARIGRRYNGAESWVPMYQQELIVYPSDKSTNRTAIEVNINNHFAIGNLSNPTSGLLATYTGAAAAYSVRQLANTAPLSMRVRRDTAGGTGDDDEADVLFDFTLTDPTISLDSRINNASAGVASTTLGEFLNATGYTDVDSLGTVADGFCDTWYDQSGAGNDAEQTGFSLQPQIFDSASPTDLIQENGKPALDFDGSNHYMITTSTMTVNSTRSDFGVFALNRNTGNGGALCSTDSISGGPRLAQNLRTTTTTAPTLQTAMTIGFPVEVLAGTTSLNTSTQYLMTSTQSTSTLTLYLDGTSENSASHTNSTGTSKIGLGVSSGTSGKLQGVLQEIVMYNSDQDAAGNRTGIETNIDDYYQIPGM